MEQINFNETFWVGISFFLFFGLLWKIGVFKLATGFLDDRAQKIREELDEAHKLKEEAQALLASYQRKQRSAEQDAKDILDHAKKEAALILDEAGKRLEIEVEKRTQLAVHKISQAETLVIQQIKDNAVDITISAARSLIVENLDKDTTKEIMEVAVDSLGRKFH